MPRQPKPETQPDVHQGGGITTDAGYYGAQAAANSETAKDQRQGVDRVKTDPFSEFGSDLAKTVPKVPTVQEDINQILSPYLKQMFSLGPEYGAEMAYLKPYLAGTNTSGIGAPSTYTGPDAGLINSNSAALSKAEATAGTALQNPPSPGFGKAANDAQSFVHSLDYQQPLTAALNYQKYLQTYGGLKPNTQTWSPEAQSAYQAILGTGGTGTTSGTGGPTLPSPVDASAGQNANTLLNQPTNPQGSH